ncbi:MAG: PHB depolymerase family esterase [Beijerinckiaceae bacterium]|jgi:feruloyl esterase
MPSFFESFASAIRNHTKGALERLPSGWKRRDSGIPSAFQKFEHGFDAGSGRLSAKPARAPHPGHKKEPRIIENFGSNPGALIMRLYTPPHPRRRPALVVVLHGCKQNAKSYDKGSGWSKLADRGGFILLYPEQQARNNPGTCFNWFEPKDIKRDSGEACSIRQMIGKAVSLHGADPARIFICGLSAGGAMAGVMLACYPEIFSAGAIIAGLPYGAASSANEAMEAMYNGRAKSAKAWGDLVRAASRHEGRWPNIAVWQGSLDTTVKPVNAGEIVKQWTNVHGLGGTSPMCEQAGVITVRSWPDSKGTPRIVEYIVAGMGHGAPIAGYGGASDGSPGPFFLSTGLWSSLRIAQDWGLFDKNGMPVKSSRFALPSFNSRMNHFSRSPGV